MERSFFCCRVGRIGRLRKIGRLGKDFDKREGNFLSEWYRCGADTKKPPMGSARERVTKTFGRGIVI